MAAMLHTLPGRTISVLSDNTTTNGAAKNFRSRDYWVNEEWKLIQTFLIANDCDIHLVRVISEDNSADRLSRGLDSSKDIKDWVELPIPLDLSTLLYQVYPIA